MLLVAVATLAMTALAPSTLLAGLAPAAPSDFDGDGRADLAIGVPGEDVGSAQDAGMVNVLYGAAGGLSAAGDQAWSQDTAGVLGTSEGGPAVAGDAFGRALASADFDRDGRADLAVGVPSDRVGTTSFAGAVNVLYGSASGLTATGDQLWSQDQLADDPETGDGFGQALAAGDFDGDGYADLAVGVPGEGLGMGVAPGMVMIIRGGADGLALAGASVLTRASTGAPYLTDSPHGFGYALAAGDLDGDGYADLAVGAPASGASGDDPMRPLVDGEAAVFYGSGTGLVTAGSQLWTQGTVGAGTAEDGDWFGSRPGDRGLRRGPSRRSGDRRPIRARQRRQVGGGERALRNDRGRLVHRLATVGSGRPGRPRRGRGRRHLRSRRGGRRPERRWPGRSRDRRARRGLRFRVQRGGPRRRAVRHRRRTVGGRGPGLVAGQPGCARSIGGG